MRSTNYETYYTTHKLNCEHYLNAPISNNIKVSEIYNLIACDTTKKLNVNTIGSLIYVICNDCFKLASTNKLQRSEFFNCDICKKKLQTLNNSFFSYVVTTITNVKGVNELVVLLLSQKPSLMLFLVSVIFPSCLMIHHFNFILLQKFKANSVFFYICNQKTKSQILLFNLFFSLLNSLIFVSFFLIFVSLLHKSCAKSAIQGVSGFQSEMYGYSLLKDLEYFQIFLNILIILSLNLSDYIWHLQISKQNNYIFQILQLITGILLYSVVLETDFYFVSFSTPIVSGISYNSQIPKILKPLAIYEELQTQMLDVTCNVLRFTKKRKSTILFILMAYIVFLSYKLKKIINQKIDILVKCI